MLPSNEVIPEIVKKTVSVNVKDSEDNSLENVTVTLTDSSNTEYTGTTDSNGACSIAEVPLGEMSVKGEKEGYTDYTGTYEVTDSNYSISIVMSVVQSEEP